MLDGTKEFTIIVLSFVLIFIAFILWLKISYYREYGFVVNHTEKHFNKELKKRLDRGEREIYIKDLTDFDWDKVYYVGAYSLEVQSSRNKETGIHDNKILSDTEGSNLLYYKKNLPIIWGDGAWGLLFIKDNIEIRLIDGQHMGYDTENRVGHRFSNKAKFKIREHKDVIFLGYITE